MKYTSYTSGTRGGTINVTITIKTLKLQQAYLTTDGHMKSKHYNMMRNKLFE